MTDSNEAEGWPRRDFLRGAGALGALAAAGAPAFAAQAAQAAGPASRAAYERLVQSLAQIGAQWLSPERGVSRAQDIAEGYRALLHFLDVGIRLYFEGDPNRPEFKPIVTPTIKMQGDNPDAFYFYTRIRGDRNYRIRGRQIGEVYLSFTVHRGDGQGGWAEGVDAEKNFRHLKFKPDGSYELLVGPDVDPEQGLRTGPRSQEIVSRHYFELAHSAQLDPALRPHLTIEALDPDPLPGAPDDTNIAQRLETVRHFLIANTIAQPRPDPARLPAWFSAVPNRLGAPARWSEKDGGGLGAVDNAYSAGRFVLEPEQALVIEGRLPQCVFANVVLWNRYLQSLDYRYRPISLNRRQMQLASDGSYRIIVAHRDPGHPNWLSTEGRADGTLYWRFLLPEGDIETPRTQVVPFADISRA